MTRGALPTTRRLEGWDLKRIKEISSRANPGGSGEHKYHFYLFTLLIFI